MRIFKSEGECAGKNGSGFFSINTPTGSESDKKGECVVLDITCCKRAYKDDGRVFLTREQCDDMIAAMKFAKSELKEYWIKDVSGTYSIFEIYYNDKKIMTVDKIVVANTIVDELNSNHIVVHERSY